MRWPPPVVRRSLIGDARLMEIGQGEWEGRTHGELEAADPASLRRLASRRRRNPAAGRRAAG